MSKEKREQQEIANLIEGLADGKIQTELAKLISLNNLGLSQIVEKATRLEATLKHLKERKERSSNNSESSTKSNEPKQNPMLQRFINEISAVETTQKPQYQFQPYKQNGERRPQYKNNPQNNQILIKILLEQTNSQTDIEINMLSIGEVKEQVDKMINSIAATSFVTDG
jgi:hypothetical protein